MVRHNNVISNVHRVKCKGRFIKPILNQAGKKHARRVARQKKAGEITPSGLLRPLVHMPTRRYNYKVRFGRGFTLQELKAAGIGKKVARTIGIAVDHRRSNKCAESLDLNVNRLKTWLSKLVLFPRKKHAKKGFSGIPDDTPKEKLATLALSKVSIKKVMPVVQDFFAEAPRAITEQEASAEVYHKLRVARKAAKAKKAAAESA
ncbi:60S ribosomal protein L13e, putative [Theileria equi strain WA]|uniref:60S ribosomal protein L13 n=1 Tax=Theileria equi strain WA TaxID=1537102 RepID=L0AXX5_THEEQ|nr:60S ribosomal protein L13e, putative [Theileria equi strain WA]AFZ80417.1 60S ribosomal protein L13e, putative [Theileria equi strain WA]|eukprot:XP_004830083.1 60S ribosomal protein L13e, putative [Theileria equi strain WA]